LSSVLFLVDKTLGKYQVLEHLGHGGMAEVYKAQQVNLDRMVALKVLHPFLAEEDGFIERFQREARIVATLRHPNIVQVIDFEYDPALDVYYMVMEFIDGPTLKDLLKDAPLPPKKATRIAAGIAEALDYAHKRGMIHRDIKPANIMFTDEETPVLTDFGIARMMNLKGLTASGAMVGTPAYMPPEVGLGQPGEGAADIYSLGVVLYQLLTGRLPFDADVPMGLIMKHINDPVPLPSKTVPGIAPELEAAILKALSKKPQERFKTGAEMAHALRVATGLETQSAPLTPIPATVTPSRPSPTLLPDDHEPLLRTWPSLPVQHLLEPVPLPTVEPSPRPHRKRLWFVRSIIALLMVLALGLTGWGAANGLITLPFLEMPTPPPTVPAPDNGNIAVITPTLSPLVTPTVTLPSETPPPDPTATPIATCVFRADVGRLYIQPSDTTVPPGTRLTVYIPLRNAGNCPWPEGVQLVFISGEMFSAPETLPLGTLAVGDRTQVLLPLLAPTTTGEYISEWEVQLPEGRRIANPLRISVTVDDIPAFTPTPFAGVQINLTPPPPLTFDSPVVVRWREDNARNIWVGTLTLQANGGTGDYRYYRDNVHSDTALSGNTLTIQWQHCKSIPLTLWIISGETALRWEGSVPFPEPERCEP